ncbi:hypothetical protein ACJ5H2_13510 [Nocardioides sp. R1-1]
METETITCEYCEVSDPYRLGTLTVTKDHGETFETIKVCPDHVELYL